MLEETYKALGALALVVSLVSPFVLNWRSRIADDVRNKAWSGATTKEVEAMGKALEGLHARASANEGMLSDFRLEVARTYAPRSEIERLEQRVLDAIRGLAERLDRVLERRSGTH